jgi:hypothetical protein
MRYRVFATAVVVSLSTSAVAMAGWHEFWHGAKTDYRRTTEWPYPFKCADQMAVRAPFEIMKDNGWRRENTLGHEMFTFENNELTSAGVHKVKWIVTQAPIHRRTVWVLRADSEESTTARVDQVQQLVQNILPEGALPEVLVSDRPPGGISGQYLDAIDRSMRSSVPPPRLPSAPGTGDN